MVGRDMLFRGVVFICAEGLYLHYQVSLSLGDIEIY